MSTIYTAAENIEVVVMSFLQDPRITSGHFGKLTEMCEYGVYRVECDGYTVRVRHSPHGWRVMYNGFEAIDPDLYTAARNALEAAPPIPATPRPPIPAKALSAHPRGF